MIVAQFGKLGPLAQPPAVLAAAPAEPSPSPSPLQTLLLLQVQWSHLDIAGPVWRDKDGGATGFGAQLLAGELLGGRRAGGCCFGGRWGLVLQCWPLSAACLLVARPAPAALYHCIIVALYHCCIVSLLHCITISSILPSSRT